MDNKIIKEAVRTQLSPELAELQLQISQGLLKLRRQKGWTRADLALILPDTAVYDLQRWESGASMPKGPAMIRVSRLLNLNLTSYPGMNLSLARREQRIAQKLLPAPVLRFDILFRAIRDQSGLTVKQVANQLSVSVTTYQNWEKGQLPSKTHAQSVADWLQLPVAAISQI